MARRTVARVGGGSGQRFSGAATWKLGSDQRGSGLLSATILVVALVLGAVGAVKSLSGRVSDKFDCAGEAVAGMTPGLGRCLGGEASGGPPPAPGEIEPPVEGPDGPALEDSGPIVALPFPGSVSVACTGLRNQRETCKDQTGVRVQATAELSIDRSETRLDVNGCPKQDLSVTTKLQVELSGKARGKQLGGALTIFTGTASKFKVTVPPDAADAIARGDRPPPNPLDPTTIGPGESLELSEEFFAGHRLQATYRQLQVEMGFDQGRRLSSGVRRIDPRTVRIFVGDSEFVRQALSVGVSIGEFGISIGGKEELANGNLRAVDIDISTQAGWDAYQKFLAEGRLPPPGAPGTSDPVTAETLDLSDALRIEARLGRVKLGGLLSDSEGHVTETRHADGTVDTVVTGRFNSVGVAVRISESPGGSVAKSFSLLIEGADREMIETFEDFSGRSLNASEDGNVRLDFTEDDLRTIQEQALDQLVQLANEDGDDISRDELERLLREDPRRLEQSGLNDTADQAFEIAAANSPEEVLYHLYLMSGFDRSGTVAVENLLGFMMQTARARHGLREFPKDHPDSLLPGTAVAPSCG